MNKFIVDLGGFCRIYIVIFFLGTSIYPFSTPARTGYHKTQRDPWLELTQSSADADDDGDGSEPGTWVINTHVIVESGIGNQEPGPLAATWH